jgi:hypothetical protein
LHDDLRLDVSLWVAGGGGEKSIATQTSARQPMFTRERTNWQLAAWSIMYTCRAGGPQNFLESNSNHTSVHSMSTRCHLLFKDEFYYSQIEHCASGVTATAGFEAPIALSTRLYPKQARTTQGDEGADQPSSISHTLCNA